MRARCAALLALVALVLAVAPAAALAQGDAFGPLPPAPSPQPEPVPAPAPADDGGLDVLDTVLIAAAALALVAGIAWFIVRDARGAAPAETRPGGGGAVALGAEGGRRGTRAPARTRASEGRRRAKAARRARRHNRPA
jgi:hypothetical protein